MYLLNDEDNSLAITINEKNGNIKTKEFVL